MSRTQKRIPMAAYYPLGWAAARLSRSNPLRRAAVLALQRIARQVPLTPRLESVQPLDWPQLRFRADDSIVIDAVYWFGVKGYEGRLPRIWEGLARRATETVEIGGNVGLYTVIGGQVARGAYTVFEPNPEVAATLRANLALNEVLKVVVFEAAVTWERTRQRVPFNIPDEGRRQAVGGHLVQGVDAGLNRTSRTLLEVDTWPALEACGRADLIKLDCEGAEHRLLSAIRPLIAERRPTLVVEVLPYATDLAALLAAFSHDYGYRIHVVPAWGTDRIWPVPPEQFSAAAPERLKSKGVILCQEPIC